MNSFSLQEEEMIPIAGVSYEKKRIMACVLGGATFTRGFLQFLNITFDEEELVGKNLTGPKRGSKERTPVDMIKFQALVGKNTRYLYQEIFFLLLRLFQMSM